MRKCVEALQGNVRVKFINEHGAEEAGVDGGGLFKDFLSATVEEAFDPKEGNFLFCETPSLRLASLISLSCPRSPASPAADAAAHAAADPVPLTLRTSNDNFEVAGFGQVPTTCLPPCSRFAPLPPL